MVHHQDCNLLLRHVLYHEVKVGPEVRIHPLLGPRLPGLASRRHLDVRDAAGVLEAADPDDRDKDHADRPVKHRRAHHVARTRHRGPPGDRLHKVVHKRLPLQIHLHRPFGASHGGERRRAVRHGVWLELGANHNVARAAEEVVVGVWRAVDHRQPQRGLGRWDEHLETLVPDRVDRRRRRPRRRALHDDRALPTRVEELHQRRRPHRRQPQRRLHRRGLSWQPDSPAEVHPEDPDAALGLGSRRHRHCA
mmetsp:Transcript_33407/g.100914  ORF Transcript_33407/g.100914 Transcript_33407/m.100914 type:complete len:250 (+) Transcript_33407:696-1445(+)